MLEQQLRFTIDCREAMFAGHFPGYPIVPGAFLLDQVIAQLCAAGVLPSAPIDIGSAKFVATIAPDSEVHLAWQITVSGSCKFECSVLGRKVASGVLQAAE